jgi:hypothetical protein
MLPFIHSNLLGMFSLTFSRTCSSVFGFHFKKSEHLFKSFAHVIINFLNIPLAIWIPAIKFSVSVSLLSLTMDLLVPSYSLLVQNSSVTYSVWKDSLCSVVSSLSFSAYIGFYILYLNLTFISCNLIS